jgi:outer membrane protein TolC
VADLYPKVTLGASVGTTALSVSDLNNKEALRFGLGPLISWSFPNIAVAEAEIQSAKASAAAALASYEGTWLDALRDTESALANYANELDRTDALRSARDQSEQAAKLARARYDAGGASFLDVLQAESTLADNSLALAQSQSQLATDQITLFLALGGGWQ